MFTSWGWDGKFTSAMPGAPGLVQIKEPWLQRGKPGALALHQLMDSPRTIFTPSVGRGRSGILMAGFGAKWKARRTLSLRGCSAFLVQRFMLAVKLGSY